MSEVQSFIDHSAFRQDKKLSTSLFSWYRVMLEFTDVWDSGFQSLHSQSSQFEWSRERMQGLSATNAASLHVFYDNSTTTFLHCTSFSVHLLLYSILWKVSQSDSGTLLWDLCTFSESLFSFFCCSRSTAKPGQWLASNFWFQAFSTFDLAFLTWNLSLITILHPFSS